MNILRVLLATLALPLGAQWKPSQQYTATFSVCVEPINAYGQHVRFTEAEHIELLLRNLKARDAQYGPYREWESASRSINWFGGKRSISLAYIKSHMPRAMLLVLRFPVNQNPPAVKADIDRLIAAEAKYLEAEKVSNLFNDYVMGLMKQYGIGPSATIDDDFGGATPFGGCNKYEEQAGVIK